jgi:hypothetical protein
MNKDENKKYLKSDTRYGKHSEKIIKQKHITQWKLPQKTRTSGRQNLRTQR